VGVSPMDGSRCPANPPGVIVLADAGVLNRLRWLGRVDDALPIGVIAESAIGVIPTAFIGVLSSSVPISLDLEF
jgi:hypothetical protein